MRHQPVRVAIGEQARDDLELRRVIGDMVGLGIARIGGIDDDQAKVAQAQPVRWGQDDGKRLTGEGLGRGRPGTRPPVGRGLGRTGTLTLAPQERGGGIQ
jgi:hypothetical protein